VQRRDGERERLRALVDGVELAPTGTAPPDRLPDGEARVAA